MIEVKDVCIKNILNDYYGEDKESFSEEELENVKSIVIDDNTIENSLLGGIKILSNVEEITFSHVFVSISMLDNICKLEDLKTIKFNTCNVSDLSRIKNSNIECLYVNNSVIENLIFINEINSLKELYLDNMENINMKEFPIIKNLKSLSLYGTEFINEDYLVYLDNVEKLCVCDSSIWDLSIFKYLDNLKYLVIDEEQAIKNKKYVLDLINNKVKVVNYLNQSVVMYYE